jgi:HSP20 family protein
MPPSVRPRNPSRQLQQWEPFRELDDLQERTAQLMQSVWSGAPLADPAVWAPPVDIEETDDAWILEAEIPGASREDVDVDVRDSEIVISGEIKERERTGILRRRTRRVGRFELRVTVPTRPDAENVEATLADGVLTVRIPKPEGAGSQHVEVQGK